MQQDQRIPLTGGKIFIMILVFFCLGILLGIIVDYILYQAWTKPKVVVVQNMNQNNTDDNNQDTFKPTHKIED